MNQIAILGLGLMGSSLGLALKRSGFSGRVTGYARRPETRDYALTHHVVDEVWSAPGPAVREADVVVVCVPILTTADVLDACLEHLKIPVVVTDVGSTKEWVCREASKMLADYAPFIGSHPICGSERQGVEAGRADLYQDATVVLTRGDGEGQREADNIVSTLWEMVGARVLRMTPREHDEMLARTSHLPHMISALLAAAVGRGDTPFERIDAFCGSGFRDTTRIAGGAPSVWLDILQTNAEAVADELAAYSNLLEYLIRCLREGRRKEIESLLVRAKQLRESLVGESNRAS